MGALVHVNSTWLISASVWWYSKRREILGKKVIHILVSHFRVTSEHFSAGQYWPTDLSQYYFHATLTDILITKAMPATRLCLQGTRFALVQPECGVPSRQRALPP